MDRFVQDVSLDGQFVRSHGGSVTETADNKGFQAAKRSEGKGRGAALCAAATRDTTA